MVASPQHSTDLLSRWSASKMVAMAKANIGNVDEKDCRKFGDLSSTLMGLYEWEKKLYKEVVDEEKLRVLYDKDCKKLRDMTDRGVDFRDISLAHSSIKRLLSRINVAVTAVDVVSTRIHKLRDEELHSQLNELIEGLVRMWKLVLECHEKQSKSIKETESCVRIKIDGIKKNSSLKEIFRLKMEISNWGRHFSNYVKLQKRFAELLNEWLSKCLSEEQEESPNVSVPLSPGKMGAPPIFIVCKDWHHAIEKISETGVSKAIHDFSSSLHQLWEKQDEERNQRLKVKHISKDIEEHIRAQGRENLISWNKDAALEIVTTLEDPTLLQDELDGNMVSMMKKLVEQKAKHDEAVQLVNNVASSCLKEGLVPIFEALESFCLENLKAYEKIRIP